MLTISTIPEALAELEKHTGRAWTDSELFDVATSCDIELHAAPPITARTTIQEFVIGVGLVERSRSDAALAVLFRWQAQQLWISGETAASHPDGHNQWEGKYCFFIEPVRVTREQVRIKAYSLGKILDAWNNTQAGAWIADMTQPSGMRHKRGPSWMFPTVTPAAKVGAVPVEQAANPTAAKVEAGAGTTPAPATRTNKLRRNNLDPAIDKAINMAGNMELADVYLQLKELAISGEKPFTGEVTGDMLHYTNDENKPDTLSKEQLRKRLDTRKRNAV